MTLSIDSRLPTKIATSDRFHQYNCCLGRETDSFVFPLCHLPRILCIFLAITFCWSIFVYFTIFHVSMAHCSKGIPVKQDIFPSNLSIEEFDSKYIILFGLIPVILFYIFYIIFFFPFWLLFCLVCPSIFC